MWKKKRVGETFDRNYLETHDKEKMYFVYNFTVGLMTYETNPFGGLCRLTVLQALWLVQKIEPKEHFHWIFTAKQTIDSTFIFWMVENLQWYHVVYLTYFFTYGKPITRFTGIAENSVEFTDIVRQKVHPKKLLWSFWNPAKNSVGRRIRFLWILSPSTFIVWWLCEWWNEYSDSYFYSFQFQPYKQRNRD